MSILDFASSEREANDSQPGFSAITLSQEICT